MFAAKKYRVAYWAINGESKATARTTYSSAVATYEALRRSGLTCALTDSDRVLRSTDPWRQKHWRAAA